MTRMLAMFISVFIASGAVAEWPRISLNLYASGLKEPSHIAHARDDRLFVVERAGRIMIVRDGKVERTPFIDIRERVETGFVEQGLLSMAFPPGYPARGYFYVNYTAKRSGETVIARYRIGSGGMADKGSEDVILRIAQPYRNHNGGQLAFGPDGYLYIGMGDGGSGGDPHGHAQNPRSLLGKMLRIDVESGIQPYGVPKENPFVNSPAHRPETWATGLRNPWRFSFDPKTGDLYIADVGQNEYEEVDIQPSSSKGGENYGWNMMEGAHCYKRPCEYGGLELPIAEYSHPEGCSITGGFVYRGGRFPALNGIYIYGDYCSGRIWGLRKAASGNWESALLFKSSLALSTFGEDAAGELYAADFSSGNIYRISVK